MKGVIGLRRLIIDGDRYQSVASIWRKLLKKTYTEERSVHANSESVNLRLGS